MKFRTLSYVVSVSEVETLEEIFPAEAEVFLLVVSIPSDVLDILEAVETGSQSNYLFPHIQIYVISYSNHNIKLIKQKNEKKTEKNIFNLCLYTVMQTFVWTISFLKDFYIEWVLFWIFF